MTPFHAMPGHLIRRLNQIAVSVFQDRMQALGFDLTPVQFAALQALGAYPGIDQATLSGLIAYDRATIGGVIDRLEGKKLIARRISRRDRRARELTLSDTGALLLLRVQPVVEALQDDILAGLDPAEKAQFIALAGKLAQAGNTRSRAPMTAPRDQAP
ncbi:MAG: MarR family winged helix-turn-helix transcriptional regulator [Pararhodobacter sp.]